MRRSGWYAVASDYSARAAARGARRAARDALNGVRPGIDRACAEGAEPLDDLEGCVPLWRYLDGERRDAETACDLAGRGTSLTGLRAFEHASTTLQGFNCL